MTGGSGAKSQFKRWLTAPPRPHGQIIKDRTVSNLELFYDLVYVAVITGAANRLTHDISLRGFAEFAVVFAMMWIAWINGSLYIELHGREDGRTRLLVFLQMGILALLAVFTERAAGSTGAQFALVYGAFLALMSWHWWSVRQLDRTERPEFLPITAWYVGGMVVSTAIVVASGFLPAEPRLLLWALYAVGWIGGIYFAGTRPRIGIAEGITPTESLVERFGLFVIIVLGEVIFGVVEGLNAVEPDLQTIAVGSLALIIGFGYWWLYFDLVGRRKPRNTRGSLAAWMLSHLPITLSITASGAAIVSLVEHAHDAATPAGTAWLIAGAVAIGLVAMVIAIRQLEDAVRIAAVYRPLQVALALGAVVALLAGFITPSPLVLAGLLVAILSALWFFAVARSLRSGAWSTA
ncbi:MAG: low temperature requirement protein A [Chloroflexi bacterium]|nr:low temperature requirement protein A [Chloroflexota bacterium]